MTVGPPGTVRRSRHAVAGAVAGMVSAAIPPFLVGTLSLQIAADFEFSASDVALGIAAYYLVSGVLSPGGGRVVAALGVTPALHLACASSTVGLGAIALASSAGQVMVALALLGVPNSLVQPASNQVLSSVSDRRLRGLSFGLVQSAIPAATLLAGLLLGVATYGSSWRYAVWTVAALTLAAQVLVTSTRPVSVPGHRAAGARDRSRPVAATRVRVSGTGGPPLMAALVLTGFLASAAATSLPAFVAASGAQVGVAPVAVAAAQVAGSLSCMAVRTTAAWRGSLLSAPRMLTRVAALLGVGVSGYLLLAWGAPAAFLAGTVLAYAGGWGWNGLFNLAVVSARPDRIAASTGLTQGGVFLGGMAGPLAFAALAGGAGHGLSWSAMSVLGIGAGACVLFAARRWRSAQAPDAALPATGSAEDAAVRQPARRSCG